MTIPRPNWHLATGPLDLRVPLDPDPCPGVDWQALYQANQSHTHQDSQDGQFSQPSGIPVWLTDNPSQTGPSGSAFAYSQPDLPAVRVACKGLKNNPHPPDVGHSNRDLIYYNAGFDMTHEVSFARGVQRVAQRCTTWPWFVETGPLSEPGNKQLNLDSLMAMAQARPHQGIDIDLRCFGNAMYAKASEHKCARILGAPVSTSWMVKALSILELAAVPGTGQVGASPGDAAHPLDQPNTEYTFHWAFTAIGAMACAFRCHLPIPTWIVPHLDALDLLPAMQYLPWGGTSLPSFTYSDGGVLRVCTGAGQNGDPNFGWWSSVCVCVARMIPDQRDYWLTRAKHWGPWPWDGYDEVNRKFTMLLRGALLG